MRTKSIPSVVFACSLVACANQGASEPVSAAEAAVTTEAVEAVVVTVAPIESTEVEAIATAYRQRFTPPGTATSCATVETNNLTFVTVRFACTGVFATTGTLQLEITSPQTVEATADLTIGGVAIAGALALAIPASGPRTLEGELAIAGTRRTLDADATASWLVDGSCLTFSASGNIIVNSAARSFAIPDTTICED